MILAIRKFIISVLDSLNALIMTVSVLLLIYPFMIITLASAQIHYIQFQEKTITIVPGASNPGNRIFYDPSSSDINSGTVVKWVNNDTVFHTVTFSTAGIYESGLIPPKGSVSHSFLDQGVFNYFCSIHPFMTANITVS